MKFPPFAFVSPTFFAAFLLPIFLLPIFLLPTSAAGEPIGSENSASEVEALRVLVYPIPPFFHRDAAGEWIGLEYDILRSFAEEAGRRLEVIEVEGFGAVFEHLDQGAGEVGSASLTIVEARKVRYDYSTPYFAAVAMLVQPRDAEYLDFEDLPGKRIALIDTRFANPFYSNTEIRKVPVEAPAELLEAVAAGRADACSIESSSYFWYGEAYPDLIPTLRLSERSFYGFVFKKGDPLKIRIDAHLQKLMDDGRMKIFLRRAFGKWEPQIIDEMSRGMFDS